MALVDLAYTADELKEEAAENKPGSIADQPKFPYGLALQLNDETLTKLGVTDLPKVGEYISIVALACVTSVSQRQEADGDEERCVSLQIEQMRLGGDSDADDDDMLPTKSMPEAKTLVSRYGGE